MAEATTSEFIYELTQTLVDEGVATRVADDTVENDALAELQLVENDDDSISIFTDGSEQYTASPPFGEEFVDKFTDIAASHLNF